MPAKRRSKRYQQADTAQDYLLCFGKKILWILFDPYAENFRRLLTGPKTPIDRGFQPGGP
jgi:hypothetical protein